LAKRRALPVVYPVTGTVVSRERIENAPHVERTHVELPTEEIRVGGVAKILLDHLVAVGTAVELQEQDHVPSRPNPRALPRWT
jgi:hypothetical protein